MVLWFTILWKAIKFRLALSRLKRAKKNAYRESLGLAPIYPIYERPFRWVGGKIKAIFLKTCCRCLDRKPGSRLSNWDKLWVNGTLPNEILKGFVGLVAGILFTILLLNFLTSQLNFNPKIVTVICITFGIVLTFGLTFSDAARCLFILGIPQFFNKKGRAAILGYVFILALSGPGKNTAMNMEILTESLVCGQDMVRNSTSDLVALAKEPFSVLKNAILSIISSIQGVLERMNNELKVVVQTIYEIVNVIKYAYTMLKSIVNLCNKKLGTPYDRCISSFEEASKDCGKKLGSAFSWMCSVVDVFQNFCYFAKIVDVFCWLPSLVKQAIFEPLKEHFKIFANGFKEFFDVRLNITYEFDHDLTQDKTLKDIARNMKAEIMEHVQWFLDYVDWMDLAVSFMMLVVVWKSFLYRYKFLNSDRYDNYYITKGMIRMDLERKKLGRDSVFPLRYRESKLYVQTFSWDMIDAERTQMKLSLFFVAIAGAQILIYVMMDYLLYMFLELIRKHGSIKINTRDALGLSATVEGEGFLASMYRSILEGLSPVGGVLPSFDTSKCLPHANKPDFHLYLLIIFLLLLCMVVAIMEPYGLRLRHIICGWIYPDRIIPRDRWLYVHILSSRDGFLVFARRFIRSKLKGDKSTFRLSIMDRLAHTFPCCRRLFISHNKKCFLCGRPGDQDDFENFLECPNCQTVYCKECFQDMENKCTACLDPIDYGDLTDVSEEFGSDSDSESEPDLIQRCFNRLSGNKSTYRRLISQENKPRGNQRVNNSNKSDKKDNGQKSKVQVQTITTTKEMKQSELPSHEVKIESSKIPAKVHQSGWLSMVFGKISSKLTEKAFGSQSIKNKRRVSTFNKRNNPQRYEKIHKPSGKKYEALGISSGSESDKHSKSYHEQSLRKPFQTRKKQIKEKTFDTKAHDKKSKINPPIFQKTKDQKFLLQQNDNLSGNGNHKISKQPKLANSTKNIKRSQKNTQEQGYFEEYNKSRAQGTSSRLKLTNQPVKTNPSSNNTPKIYEQKLSKAKYPSEMKNTSKSDFIETETPHSSIGQRNVFLNQNLKNIKETDSNFSEIEANYPGQPQMNYDSFKTPIVDDPYEDASSTIYVEELDGQDANGVCHHHQQVEPETLTKFDNVLSQMSFVYPEMSQSGHSSGEDRIQENATPYQRENFEETCPTCTEPIASPQNAFQLGVPPSKIHPWWNQDIEKFPKKEFWKPPKTVAPGIRDKVEALNTFYEEMPYPPHCNL